ncbi:MAG: hypothetical protein QOE54_6453 [Streptosporangiaceae bacterium]|jgi:hypothetical protein|nr:hypothetical protein [Streptosporangiaceae bacterium]MDX6434087.1 hypothetical protein [Streptosporangiaceae bacterium]
MNDAPLDDLVLYSALFVIILLVSSLLLWMARLALVRWGPREPEPSLEERARSAVLQLQSVGVDVPGLLGEWSPVDQEGRHSAGTRP